MLKVFLVDDEYYERRSLKINIPWENYGMEVVGEANNGETALESILGHPVDIAVVDINMPRLNGLELISRLSEHKINCKYIILTGYNEFKYAQQAIRLGVSDYILKPINYENLQQTLNGLRKEIEEQGNLTKQMSRLKTENERFYMERYYNDLVNCNFTMQNIEQYDNRLAAKLRINFELMQIVVLTLHNPPELEKLRVLQESVEEGFERKNFICCMDNKNRLFFLIDAQAEKVFPNMVCAILEFFKEKGYEASAGVGNTCDSIDKLYRSYNEACIALQNCFLLKQQIIRYQDICTTSQSKIDARTKNQIRTLIIERKTEDLGAILIGIFENMEKDRVIWDGILMQTLELLNLLTESLSSQVSSPVSVLNVEGSILDTLNSMKEIRQVENWVIQTYTGAIKNFADEEKDYSNTTICVENYVQEHYHEPELSITAISKALYSNYSYICYCFKRDKQMTINDYVNKVRIEKAVEMFQNHVENVGFVADKTGFSSASYFSKQFKRATGLPPSDYIKTLS